MEAKELRVGNYIQDVETGRKGFINRINGNRLTVKLEHSTLNQHFEEFKPIELTEEILLKCGFEKIDYHRFKIKPSVFDYYYTISIHDNCFRKYVENYIFCLNTVFYLHQLQNIFYALCNEELNIEL